MRMLTEVRGLDVWDGATVQNTYGGFHDDLDFSSDDSDEEEPPVNEGEPAMKKLRWPFKPPFSICFFRIVFHNLFFSEGTDRRVQYTNRYGTSWNYFPLYFGICWNIMKYRGM